MTTLLKTQVNRWKNNPRLLIDLLETSILRADEWWAKQFFGYILKFDFMPTLKIFMPGIIARVAYYKFYKLLSTMSSDDRPQTIWSIIKELIYAYKARDAYALATISFEPEDYWSSYPEVIEYLKYSYAPGRELQPETVDLIPKWPIYYAERKQFLALEFLLHNRRPSTFIDLNIPPTTKTEVIPYYYCASDPRQANYYTYFEFKFYDIVDNPEMLNHFLYGYTAHSMISIEPDENRNITYTNNYIWFSLLDYFSIKLGIPIDKIPDLCNRYLSCILTGEDDA